MVRASSCTLDELEQEEDSARALQLQLPSRLVFVCFPASSDDSLWKYELSYYQIDL